MESRFARQMTRAAGASSPWQAIILHVKQLAQRIAGGAMSRPVIITCAVTGAGDTVGKHPAIPVTPEQIAGSSIEAAKAGAAILHIHVRDPETGKATGERRYFREVVERIR